MTNRKRIGILGGTFNPIHTGHMVMALMALEQVRLDKVVFVPSYWPPHKSHSGVVAVKHRLNMIKRAIRGNPLFSVSDFEARRTQRSYSIDTVRHFQKIFKGAKLFFIIGSDMLTGLSKWKSITEVKKIVTFIVVNRPGFLNKGRRGGYRFVIMPSVDVSSSEIRHRLHAKKNVQYFLPPLVEAYIKRHRLYKKK